MARIVLATFGSFGDLHPFLGLAVGLRERGHHPVIATSEVYRSKIEAEGIEFAPVRPDVGELLGKNDLLERLWHPRHGTEFLLREYILPALEQSYQDLLSASDGADLLLNHSVTYAGPIVAEIRRLPWLSVTLQPAVFLSAYDPPELAPALWLKYVYKLGRRATQTVFALGRLQTHRWGASINHLRRRLGLKSVFDPILGGQFSPSGTLALFSRHFAPPQPDWPPEVTTTGFVFYDRRGLGFENALDSDMNRELMKFLDSGSPPILFTLGSSAVMRPGRFYKESLAAAKILGRRAILLIGTNERDQLTGPVPDSVFVADYLPYSEVMPRCAAVVHQGGIGTTAQTLRSGRPMLIVPWGHDQPDNAARVRKLGVGGELARNEYRAEAAAQKLEPLLNDVSLRQRAAEFGRMIRAEDGVGAACEAIERTLRKR